jgi:hypothetical protein
MCPRCHRRAPPYDSDPLGRWYLDSRGAHFPDGVRFDLPSDIHFSSQLNLSVEQLAGDTVDDKKTLLFEHRLTPASVTWPSGLGWNIT